MMSSALTLLLILGCLGAFDTLWYHEFQQQLPTRATGRLELRLHAVRAFFYAVLFGSLAWISWNGLFAWLLAAILAAEILITLWDFVEEDLRRPLPSGERVMHTVMAIVYGAFLACLVPQLVRWSQQPTAFARSDYGWISAALTVMALGVLGSGIRDLAASCRHGVSSPRAD